MIIITIYINIAKSEQSSHTPGGSHQRPYHLNLLERNKKWTNIWLILLYMVQLVISDVCTKFQNPRSISSSIISDENFHIHYIEVKDRERYEKGNIEKRRQK